MPQKVYNSFDYLAESAKLGASFVHFEQIAIEAAVTCDYVNGDSQFSLVIFGSFLAVTVESLGSFTNSLTCF